MSSPELLPPETTSDSPPAETPSQVEPDEPDALRTQAVDVPSASAPPVPSHDLHDLFGSDDDEEGDQEGGSLSSSALSSASADVHLDGSGGGGGGGNEGIGDVSAAMSVELQLANLGDDDDDEEGVGTGEEEADLPVQKGAKQERAESVSSKDRTHSSAAKSKAEGQQVENSGLAEELEGGARPSCSLLSSTEQWKPKATGDRVQIEALPNSTPFPDTPLHMLRLPNVVGISERAFDRSTYVEAQIDHVHESSASGSGSFLEKREQRLRAINRIVENKIRWRKVLSAEGKWSIESNTRFVTWSDGSSQLMIGAEAFDVVRSTVDATKNFIFMHSQAQRSIDAVDSNLESKADEADMETESLPDNNYVKNIQLLRSLGLIVSQIKLQVGGLQSASHQRLKDVVFEQLNKKSKIQIDYTEVNPEAMRNEMEKAANRSRRRAGHNQNVSLKESRTELTADFLEGNDDLDFEQKLFKKSSAQEDKRAARKLARAKDPSSSIGATRATRKKRASARRKSQDDTEADEEQDEEEQEEREAVEDPDEDSEAEQEDEDGDKRKLKVDGEEREAYNPDQQDEEEEEEVDEIELVRRERRRRMQYRSQEDGEDNTDDVKRRKILADND